MAIQYGIIRFEKDKVVICDLDGTLADVEHRRHHVQKIPKDWNSFFAGIADDPVRKDVADKLIDFYNRGYSVVYVSARSEKYRDVTMKWLQDHSLSFAFTLFMRPDNDTRPDTEIKKKILDMYFPDKSVIHCVIDDRPQVIKMWRENGLSVIDVGDGIDF